MNGHWTPVPDWPYEVNDVGDCRRAAPGGNGTKVGRLLKPNADKDGYLYVRLSRGGIVRDFKIHYLVCLAFHGPKPAPELQVRHRDGNRRNNTPANLLWGTSLENAQDRDEHGNTQRGETSHRALLTQSQADEVRVRYAKLRVGRLRVPRGSRRLLAAEYGLTVQGLATIISGRGYNDVAFAD